MIKEASDWVKLCLNEIDEVTENKIVLDIACGSGRNSVFISDKVSKVISVDLNIDHLLTFNGSNIFKIQSDIENLSKWPFKNKSVDIVIVTNFLNRLIFEKIQAVIKKNSFLIYETFGEGHDKIGKPKNKDYLLKKGELLKLTRNMSLIFYEEIQVISLEKKFIKHRILCKNV